MSNRPNRTEPFFLFDTNKERVKKEIAGSSSAIYTEMQFFTCYAPTSERHSGIFRTEITNRIDRRKTARLQKVGTRKKRMQFTCFFFCSYHTIYYYIKNRINTLIRINNMKRTYVPALRRRTDFYPTARALKPLSGFQPGRSGTEYFPVKIRKQNRRHSDPKGRLPSKIPP